MSARNHWITFPEHDVARWEAILPAPRGDAGALVRFGGALAAAGKRYRVWDARRLAGAVPFDATKQSFEEYLAESARTHGRVPLVPLDVRPGDASWTPAVLAFYRGEQIVEEEVGDVGALLRALRPGREMSVARSASPVTIAGMSVAVDAERDVRIVVRLESDIWFPRVVGMAEDIPDEDERPESYDNRELAQRYMPRLNSFLDAVRSSLLAAGGRWQRLQPDGFGMNYADQWDERGIVLGTG